MLTKLLGNVIVFMPPLACTKEELKEMVSIMKKAIVTGNRKRGFAF